MSEVEQLEKRIEGLPPEELASFRAWFVEFDAQAWDRQIKADLQAGKLDGLIDEAVADYQAGRAREI